MHVINFPWPKFSVGQTVYYTSSERIRENADCPDCLGSKKWMVTTPAGQSFDVRCVRCIPNAYSIPTYQITRFKPRVHDFEIDEIIISTSGKITYRKKHSEMAEDRLIGDKEEAASIAASKASDEEHRNLERCEKRMTQLNGYLIIEALAEHQNNLLREAEHKYAVAIAMIADLPDDYTCDVSDVDVRRVARHLLEELNEDIPEKWSE